ncbi:MAG: glycosyltransferase [Oribacterium sp.]|nr:glycosyltransferase [Oribacterium sp.]
MKVHITNINGIAKEAPVRRWQNYLSEIGRGLGFLEMGIYVYPSEQEENALLSTRLDGIIASVEAEDVIFVQLPTGNGDRFEQRLIGKLKAYPDTKVIGILRDELDYLEKTWLLNMLDGIWVPYKKSLTELQGKGLSVRRTWVSYFDETWDAWHIRKELLEIVDTCRTGIRSKHSDEDEIQVAFCVTDRTGSYTEFVGIAMQSIVDHTKSQICFRVIHDGTIQLLHQKYLSEIAENSGDRVVFYQVDPKTFETDNAYVKNFSIASMFRLAIPDLLPTVSKVIYLDADIVFSIDIDELWKIDLEGHSLAAIGDYGVNQGIYESSVVSGGNVKRENYFNSGVLVMKLSEIRKKFNLLHEAVSYVRDHPKLQFPDQDALNVLFKDDVLLLDWKWNFNCNLERVYDKNPPSQAVFHFMGTSHVNQESMKESDKLAIETSYETPWSGAFAKREMFLGFGALSFKMDQLQKLMKRTNVSGCKKIYYGEDRLGMQSILALFPPKEGDYFIQLKDETERLGCPCKKFEALLDEEINKIAVIVDPGADEGRVLDKLRGAGLKQGVDFFAIPAMLLASQGGYRI